MYWDCHSHLQFSAYDGDREEVIARMRDKRVKTIVVGTNLKDSKQAIALSEQYPDVVVGVTVGVHPTEFNAKNNCRSDDRREEESRDSSPTVQNGKVVDWNEFKTLAQHPNVVAVGECGLDFFHADRSDVFERQKEGLLAQIDVASEVEKPLMIHCRDAFDDLIPVLRHYFQQTAPAERFNKRFRPIIHFFTGTTEHAKQLIELGAYFTFGGVITFTNDYDKQIRLVPKERILSETDAPFVSPEPYRGKRNEPTYVVSVVPRLAELKSMSTSEMANCIAKNAKTLFGFV